MTILDANGNPYRRPREHSFKEDSAVIDAAGTALPSWMTKPQYLRQIRIDEDGLPTNLDGSSVLSKRPMPLYRDGEFEEDTATGEMRQDSGVGWTGNTPLLQGYGNPGYRSSIFQNTATGVGTSRDKTTYGNYWAPWRIMDSELLAMYNGSPYASKIVEAPSQEMFRRGYEVQSRDLTDDDLGVLDDKAGALRLNEILLEGDIWGRLFGGALNIIGAEDGNNPDEPLNEDTIKTFHYLNIVDRRFVWVQRYYSDELSPKFGLPEIYLISNAVSSGGMYGTTNPPPGTRMAAVSIHESRLIRFDGTKTDVLTRQQLAGWTWSVLQRCYDTLRQFDNAFISTGVLLSDASQAIYKVKNLIKMIAGNEKGALLARWQMIDFTRSSLRAVLLDADGETFERMGTQFTGIPDILDRFMMALAAAANMPVTRLFGRAPAGLNATGESDIRLWLDQIRSRQENELGPKLKRLYRLMALAKDSGIKIKNPKFKFQIAFNQLWEPTDAEQADTELKFAQRDQIYLDEGVVTPEQVALSRYGKGKFQSFTKVDVDALQKAVEGNIKFDPYANEPEPTGALVNAAQQGEMQSPVVPLPLPGAPSLRASEAQKNAESPQRTTEAPLLKEKADPEPQTKLPKKKDGLEPIHLRKADNAGRPKDARYDSDAIATAVHHQLSEDYPEESISWVLGATWKGPVRVDLDKIDFSGQDRWAAAHDPVKVSVMKDRIESGIEKPIILVKVPHSKMLKVIDGHHRTTGYQKLKKNPKAYIAKVNATNGPWDFMHSSQKEGDFESSQQKTPDDSSV